MKRLCPQYPLICVAAILASGGLGRAFLSAETNELPGLSRDTVARSKDRVREGTTLVNVPGVFKLTGDRATFYPADGSGKFGGLENLTLERVANVIGEDPTPMEWLISGTVTEYKGNNYLLLTRAILKSKPMGSKKSMPASKP